MKKIRLTERLQQLAGIRPLYTLNEAINKSLMDFGTDLKKHLEELTLQLKMEKGDHSSIVASSKMIEGDATLAAIILSNQDTDLNIIVNDSKIDVLKGIIKKYSLTPMTDMKKSDGWDGDSNKKSQSEGEIYMASKEIQRSGKTFQIMLRKFDPSEIFTPEK